MNILKELEIIALQKDPETQQKIIAIKKQLTPLLLQSSSMLAIRPEDIKQAQDICPEVLELVAIVKNILCNKSNGKYTTIKQIDITEEWRKRNPGKSFEFSRLDAMERIYQENGWKVSYDKPWRDEDYDAYFTFKAQ